MARSGYESLLARRRRRERRRRRAIATAVLSLGFLAGYWIVRSTGAEATPRVADLALPAVAAGDAEGVPVARYFPKPRSVESEPAPAPVPPEPQRPPVPAEVLAILPPSARVAAGGSSDHGALRDRIIERSDTAFGATGVMAPLEIEYTIDPALTDRVMDILHDGRVELGHVIVMDPVDGRVLAYASTDPLAFAATRAYPMASLMKVVTASAVLGRAPEAMQRPCRFSGSPYYLSLNLLDPPSRGHTATFVDALATSNNQCFAQLAVHELGSLAVVDQMQRLGLLEAPAPGHEAGQVDPVADRMALGQLGCGLAGSRISPLAAARLAATLVDGQIVTPHWIARVRDASGTDLVLPAPPNPRQALTPGVVTELRSMMVQTTVRGTARRAFHARDGRLLLDPIPVAGKTGSLNGVNPDGHYEWFIGIAPAEQPSVVIATLVVNRGRWRRSASQVAAEVLQAVFCQNGGCRAEAGARRTADRVGDRSDRG